ncbi:MAG TPA: hypothetical protein VK427_06605 [Kofleriaceae bacterium]|nr:hypothetical protein [Kofleriaceae bacterium]
MNLKAFLVASLQSALDLAIATPEDILKYVTTDVLATYVPRPLWARLLAATLGAPRVDARLVIETIGVANLCEHVPAQLIWACLAEVGNRSLGRSYDEAPVLLRPLPALASQPLTAPPPDVIERPNPFATPPASFGPSIPTPAVTPVGSGTQSLSDIVAELEAEEGTRDQPAAPPTPSRVRTPTQQRFRQSQTGIGRLAAAPATPVPAAPSTRRPQAAASPGGRARRGETEAEGEEEAETSVGRDEEWRASLAVEEDQLVEWQTSDETIATSDDTNPRKR